MKKLNELTMLCDKIERVLFSCKTPEHYLYFRVYLEHAKKHIPESLYNHFLEIYIYKFLKLEE
jgi:hypothetical protein